MKFMLSTEVNQGRRLQMGKPTTTISLIVMYGCASAYGASDTNTEDNAVKRSRRVSGFVAVDMGSTTVCKRLVRQDPGVVRSIAKLTSDFVDLFGAHKLC